MSKSGLTIHKEIEKKAYAESPLGIAERKMTKFYDDMMLKKETLPEEVAKKVSEIREENEKWQMDYIDRTNKEHKEAVDAKLLESFTKELEVLKEHGYNVQ